MKKNIFKYIIGIIGILLFFFFLKVTLIFSDLHPYELSENYYLIGNGSEDYTIKKGLFGKTVVSNLTSRSRWVITPLSIHGSMGRNERRYFYLNKKTSETNYFVNFSKFRNHLKEHGHKKYIKAKHESLINFRYGYRKDRIYK